MVFLIGWIYIYIFLEIDFIVLYIYISDSSGELQNFQMCSCIFNIFTYVSKIIFIFGILCLIILQIFIIFYNFFYKIR